MIVIPRSKVTGNQILVSTLVARHVTVIQSNSRCRRRHRIQQYRNSRSLARHAEDRRKTQGPFNAPMLQIVRQSGWSLWCSGTGLRLRYHSCIRARIPRRTCGHLILTVREAGTDEGDFEQETQRLKTTIAGPELNPSGLFSPFRKKRTAATSPGCRSGRFSNDGPDQLIMTCQSAATIHQAHHTRPTHS